jgi:hypothetical protein
MADKKPIYVDASGNLVVMQSGDTLGIANGGTGATTAAAARTGLGLAIGTDVLAYSLDLTNLTALNTTTGIPARTGTNTWSMRTITGSTRVSVTNGGGVAGNPTLDLSTYSDGGGGSFLKFTRDSQGLISGTTAVVQGDITTLVNSVYAPIASPTFTGTVTLPTQTPSAALEAASKGYVDAMVAGQRVKDAVRVATTATGTLSTAYENGDTVDGVVLATGDRILIKNQTTGSENGVYIVAASGTPTRATDFDGNSSTGEVVGGATFWVNEGTTNGDTAWTLTNDGTITVNTTSLTFTQSSGLGQVTASAPLSKSGNVLSATLSARIVNTANAFDLASGIATPGTYTKVTVDTYGRVTLGATAVPSDIGAQPVDTGLTNIAALTGAGYLAFSATDVAVMRTLTGSARVTVSNGDGTTGNPVFDLASGVVTPGTYNSVTVDTYGRVTAGTSSASTYLADNFTNNNAGTIVIGRAVYATGTTDKVDLANANASGTKDVIGLVQATSIASSASGSIAVDGIMVATTVQWDVVTGQSGGLTPGARYFLSNSTAGALTTTAPSTGYLCDVGVAMSTTKMKLRFGLPVQL